MSETCQGCQGQRVTAHTTVAVELDDQGNQVSKTREYTAPCGTCHGNGTVD
ncbi:hypothetical protein [Streptomyces sp. RKAG293]|uniref:hypothetical protein n=1 Tax=Streptomyces sp. RKAG293 TaxID=2893403 RepID=UPI00203442E9|nr:hypothetical protein [Streptomyces sp. RKAG293]MCM2416800.1 hypothetical protein [Streptomyces sp. RKAG293]